MATQGDDLTVPILVGLGAALVGIGGYVAWSEYEKRQTFRTRLAGRLAEHGLALVTSDLGRSSDAAPLWQLTVQHPALGVFALSARYPLGADPYSELTGIDLARRVLSYFQSGVPLAS